jgi:hypothetical protein
LKAPWNEVFQPHIMGLCQRQIISEYKKTFRECFYSPVIEKLIFEIATFGTAHFTIGFIGKNRNPSVFWFLAKNKLS